MTDELQNTTDSPKPRHPRPVLLVSKDSLSRYGIAFRHLLLGLADNSISPVIVCPPKCNLDYIALPAVEVIKYPFFNVPLIFNKKNYSILSECISKFKPNIIHCFCPGKQSLAKKLSKTLNLNYVLTLNSLEKKYKISGVSSKRCSAVLLPSPNIVENFSKLHPELIDKVRQINPGTFAKPHINCFEKTDQVVGMVTAIDTCDAEKTEAMLSAIRHLTIDGYEFMLVIIVSGKSEKPLRKLIHQLGLTKIVTIISQTFLWKNILASSDIYIQTIPDNWFNPMLLEAMAAGLAVAGAKGQADNLILEDMTATVFDPMDELSIYSAIQKLLSERDYARRLAQNNRDMIKKHHSVSSMVNAIIEVYRQCLL